METIDKNDILECLSRSGYLMEGRIIRALNQSGFFVEPNQAILDPLTGKSREIDLIAEVDSRHMKLNKICVKTFFAIEAVNNMFPIVLLSRREWTPNSPFEYYLKYKYTPSEDTTSHPFTEVFPTELKGLLDIPVYSQYCCISKKQKGDNRGELMASHSDDLYSGIEKLKNYTLDCFYNSYSWMDDKEDDQYWRIFMWYPVVVIHEGLYIFSEETNDLHECQHACLEINSHFQGDPEPLLIHFVTEKHLTKFMREEVENDMRIEAKIEDLRNKLDSNKAGERNFV